MFPDAGSTPAASTTNKFKYSRALALLRGAGFGDCDQKICAPFVFGGFQIQPFKSSAIISGQIWNIATVILVDYGRVDMP